MNLYVIRHGQTEVNLKQQINGINDIDLNQTGIEQAKQMEQKIKELSIDLIYCSPLKRTVNTAKIVNTSNIPIIYDNRIIERDTGNMMYQSVSVLDLNLWFDKNKDIIYENVEGFKSTITRMEDFINNIKQAHQNKNILLVTHGDVYKAIDVISKNGNIDMFYPENCEIKKYIFN